MAWVVSLPSPETRESTVTSEVALEVRDLAVSVDGVPAGTLEDATTLTIGPESADILSLRLAPSAEGRLHAADALAAGRSLAYRLEGSIRAAQQLTLNSTGLNNQGGTLVGAPLKGRVLIVDDVMSAGTAARESIAIIKAAGATPHAVAIALDRQEKATKNGQDVDHSAVQYVRHQLGMQVCAIARLADLLLYLEQNGEDAMRSHHEKVLAYRQRYGVNEG